MRAKLLVLSAVVVGVSGPARGQERFTAGHVFISVIETGEICDWDAEGIVEVDPATGEAWMFATDSSSEMCGINGLRFTPDGGRLLGLNVGRFSPPTPGWVQAFNPDGTSEIILDGSDGLVWPTGSNGLAFDAAGDLYIVDRVLDAILRYPGAAGPPTVFADAEDGIDGSGPLAFAPNGDLFYAAPWGYVIIRITPQGEPSIFDTFPGQPDQEAPSTLDFDSAGNLFVATHGDSGSVIYRYENADASKRRVLSSAFPWGVMALAVSPDDTVLYAATGGASVEGYLFAVDPIDGTTTLVSDTIPDYFSSGHFFAIGMAIFPPRIAGDLDFDGDVDLVDFAGFDLCSTGPGGGPVDPECQDADMDNDGDVDRADFALFQIAFTGP